MIAGRIAEGIMEGVRSLTHTTWKPKSREVIAYRTAVLNAQSRTCAYCRRPIYRDEVGFRELDHVLPKSKAPDDDSKFDDTIATSNASGDRRHTRGYPSFMYEPENLVIACKLCNSSKGSFDSLAERSVTPVDYPDRSDAFEWVHPYFDLYDQHIRLVAGHLYAAVRGSTKGKAVIRACGLDDAEGLRKRLLDSYVFSKEELSVAMVKLVLSREPFDPLDISLQLCDEYGVGTPEDVAFCLRNLLAEADMGSERLSAATALIGVRLNVAGPIMPVEHLEAVEEEVED